MPLIPLSRRFNRLIMPPPVYDMFYIVFNFDIAQYRLSVSQPRRKGLSETRPFAHTAQLQLCGTAKVPFQVYDTVVSGLDYYHVRTVLLVSACHGPV